MKKRGMKKQESNWRERNLENSEDGNLNEQEQELRDEAEAGGDIEEFEDEEEKEEEEEGEEKEGSRQEGQVRRERQEARAEARITVSDICLASFFISLSLHFSTF
jgi:hypothetical protein